MATLRDIRRRITSVQKTQQITKAMKMVAAAKLRRAQERVEQARPYAESLAGVLARISANTDPESNPYFRARETVKSITYIIVSADRGFCGGFNSNVFKTAKAKIDESIANGLDVKLIVAGKKGVDFFKRRNYPIVKSYSNIFRTLEFENALEISNIVQKLYLSGETDEVRIFYTVALSAIKAEVHNEQCMPIKPSLQTDETIDLEYIYEPSPAEMLSHLCPSSVHTQVWQALLESYAAEEGARMVAMESATDNAQEMIESLTMHYNKARQAAITTEISEIIGGAEALK